MLKMFIKLQNSFDDLNHVTIIWGTDFPWHLLAPSVWFMITTGALYIGCVALRLKPGSANGLLRGAVFLWKIIAFLKEKCLLQALYLPQICLLIHNNW